MKKNHFELKNYVMATGVFILAVIAGILIFFECVQRAVQVNSQNTLKINVQRQSEHLRRYWILIINILMRLPLQWEDQKNFFQKKIKND